MTTERDYARHTDLVELRKTFQDESRETRKVLQGLRDDLAADRIAEQERRTLDHQRFDLLERKVDACNEAARRDLDKAHDATRAVKAEVHDLKCRMGIGDDCGPKCPSVWVANPFMLAWFYPGRAAVFTILVAAILIQESRAWLLSLLPPLRWGVSL